MDVEHEIAELKRRVGDLEGAVNVLSGQMSKVHPNLVALTDTTGRRFDQLDGLIGRAVARLDTLNTQVWSLRDDLPNLVIQAMTQTRGD